MDPLSGLPAYAYGFVRMLTESYTGGGGGLGVPHRQKGWSLLSTHRCDMKSSNWWATLARWKVKSAGTPRSFPRAQPRKQLETSAVVPSQGACESSTLVEIRGLVLCISSAALTHAV